jgi:hypothetical protein|tara:strand:- start:2747 stop:3604 length:858 start_codon:yes stop_codon:yes gene_type:complete
MRLRDLFEAPERTAVMAFGRMNPPTIGHAKLVDAVTSQGGDPYIFLSQSQKPKTDPLTFTDKLRYAKFFFPNVTIGNPEVKTIIQALTKLNDLGYDNLVYVAGSDRVESFNELINKYNGTPDKAGNIAYTFKNINVVSAGARDPDADGAEGMSASKMRAAAVADDLESFKQGVPNQEVADEMFAAVRQGMGIRDNEPVTAEQGTNEMASYSGNVGIIELVQFYSKAKENGDTELLSKVQELINAGEDKQVWAIVQKYTGTTLVGKEFQYESIATMIATERKKNKK